MTYNVFQGNALHENGTVADADEVNKHGLFGDGSDGSYTSGNNLTPGKVYNFTDFTLNSGDTLSSTATNSGEPIIVKVQGDVTIEGTIDLQAKGFSRGEGYNQLRAYFETLDTDGGIENEFLVGPGFGNWTSYRRHVLLAEMTRGTNGMIDSREKRRNAGIGALKYNKHEWLNSSTGVFKINSGTSGGDGSSGFGSSGSSAGGSGGGGGCSYDANGNNGSRGVRTSSIHYNDDASGGSGGAGGGSMLIFCGSDFTFADTATIDIRGEDGQDGQDGVDEDDNVGAGGGGGGGAGMFWSIYQGNIVDDGTKLSAGGSGGSGGSGTENGGSGGSGANGTIIFEAI